MFNSNRSGCQGLESKYCKLTKNCSRLTPGSRQVGTESHLMIKTAAKAL